MRLYIDPDNSKKNLGEIAIEYKNTVLDKLYTSLLKPKKGTGYREIKIKGNRKRRGSGFWCFMCGLHVPSIKIEACPCCSSKFNKFGR